MVHRLMATIAPEGAVRDVVDHAPIGDISGAAVTAVESREFSHGEFPHHLRNLDTKGEVSPRRMKWPEGPSPRNSENQDSCSISSLRIARAKS